MSTLGKVLAVLVTLSLFGWIFLAAGVTRHHQEWAKQIADLKAEVARLEPELPPLVAEIQDNMGAATNYQVLLEKERLNFRASLAMAQKVESDTKETLSRTGYQETTAKQEAVAAQARQEVRAREKNDLVAEIAREQAGVEQLKAENKSLRDELANLQKAFLTTVAENKTYADRLLKGAGNGAKPAASSGARTRLGSFVR